ncbi:hypothetical protein PoB_002833700 [Plakobranchus ocellatus]|uniref:Uncharacterized protein n=1 Tax=Plakobranchus ocellatus TaxID=259542 RepID=A0AAV4A4L0_9GAST|nr:hypothetical protein PoB_002833700 [Plakobranchus ocellatus]
MARWTSFFLKAVVVCLLSPLFWREAESSPFPTDGDEVHDIVVQELGSLDGSDSAIQEYLGEISPEDFTIFDSDPSFDEGDYF